MLNSKDYEEVKRLKRKIDTITGSGGITVQHTAYGINIHASPQKPITSAPQSAAVLPNVAILSIGSPVVSGYGYPSVRWAYKVTVGQVTITTRSDWAVFCGDTLSLNPPDAKCIFVNAVNNYSFATNSAQVTGLSSTVPAIKIGVANIGDTYPETAERGKSYDVYMGVDVHIGNNVVTGV